MADKIGKFVTVRDIALALGISTGTVDRALHGRRYVNRITKMKVLQKAKELGYRPNLAARYLSTRRELQISINIPAEIASFFDLIQKGIEDEAEAVAASGIKLSFNRFPRLGVGEEEALEAALAAKVDGIILVPGHPGAVKSLIRRAKRANIPVVCVASDAPHTDRLTVVSIDPCASGSLAGELISRFLVGSGTIAVVTGDLAVSDHAQKSEAFLKVTSASFPNIHLLPIIETHDSDAEAYEKFRDLLRLHSEISAVYVATSNSLPILRALEEFGYLGKVTLITTDLFPELIERIRRGHVTATIYQRPRTQGLMAFRSLYKFITEGTCPAGPIRLAPHLVLRGNLEFFLSQEPMSSAENQNIAV
jgi:LacI family transcriptional regulator